MLRLRISSPVEKGVPELCQNVHRAIGQGQASVGDIMNLGFLPVFSDQSGRLAEGAVDQMTSDLRYQGESDSILIDRNLAGTRDSSVTVQAGSPIYQIVQKTSSEQDKAPCSDPLDCLRKIFDAYNKQVRCDRRLGEIFGGEGSVVATAFEPANIASGRPRIRWREGAYGEDPAQGVWHQFANRTSTPESGSPGFVGNLFVPKGFASVRGKADPYFVSGVLDTKYSNIRVTYVAGSLSRFGWAAGLSLSFVHAGPVNRADRIPSPIRSSVTNAAGSVLIGTIGADGSLFDGGGGGGRKFLTYRNGIKSDDPFTPGDYIHNHVITYDGNGTRVDIRKVFCGDLGFR